jgi:hypothetical protein
MTRAARRACIQGAGSGLLRFMRRNRRAILVGSLGLVVGSACKSDVTPTPGRDSGVAAADAAPRVDGGEVLADAASGLPDASEPQPDAGMDPVDSGMLADTGPAQPADSGVLDEPDSGVAAALPDFQLADLNPTSARTGEVVSPRDYLEKVSGWYFTHAS